MEKLWQERDSHNADGSGGGGGCHHQIHRGQDEYCVELNQGLCFSGRRVESPDQRQDGNEFLLRDIGFGGWSIEARAQGRAAQKGVNFPDRRQGGEEQTAFRSVLQ